MKPCLDCGTPAEGSRCPAHQVEAERAWDRAEDAHRPGPRRRGYDARWERLSARARRRQPFCADCGSTHDLTADHKRWPAGWLDDVEVVCRSCNSKRGPIRDLTTT